MMKMKKGKNAKTLVPQASYDLCGIGARQWHLGCFI